MRELVTSGDICLKDEYNLVYKIAEITYREREDESFIYEIRPNYSVISLLKVTDFQGIPGIRFRFEKRSLYKRKYSSGFLSANGHLQRIEKICGICWKNGYAISESVGMADQNGHAVFR